MSEINQKASQLLIQKKIQKPNKAKNPIKTQTPSGLDFLNNPGFSEPVIIIFRMYSTPMTPFTI